MTCANLSGLFRCTHWNIERHGGNRHLGRPILHVIGVRNIDQDLVRFIKNAHGPHRLSDNRTTLGKDVLALIVPLDITNGDGARLPAGHRGIAEILEPTAFLQTFDHAPVKTGHTAGNARDLRVSNSLDQSILAKPVDIDTANLFRDCRTRCASKTCSNCKPPAVLDRNRNHDPLLSKGPGREFQAYLPPAPLHIPTPHSTPSSG